MVTMTLPFSFWTKPKYDAGVREAAANRDAATAAYEALKNQVLFEIKDLLAKIEAAEKLITLYRTTVIPQAQQTLESARAGYQVGKTEFLAMLDAQRAIKDFHLDYYRSLTAFQLRPPLLERGQRSAVVKLEILDRALGIEHGQKLRLAHLVARSCGLQGLLRLRNHGRAIERDQFLRRFDLRQQILDLEQNLVLERFIRGFRRVPVRGCFPHARVVFRLGPEGKREAHGDHAPKAVPRAEVLEPLHHHVV